MRRLVLQEWEKANANNQPKLKGLSLNDKDIARAALALKDGDLLRVENGHGGLSIEARRYVGVVQLGPLQVTVQPRLPPEDLWYILAYGLGLNELKRHTLVELLLPEAPFTDLLALALLEEADRLWRRGLRRGYFRRDEWLSSPRGRVDMTQVMAATPLSEAALPCSHHQLSLDTPENQMVHAGLWLASQMAYTPSVKAALRKAERRWGEVCHRMTLDTVKLQRLEQGLTRLTAAYAPALRLITALHGGRGMPDELETMEREDEEAGPIHLPGFLWNMASLFEKFVSIFLSKHLPDVEVLTQENIDGLYKVLQAPPKIRKPRPRPDVLVKRAGRVVAVLDTKYKDLEHGGLDSEILYQMSVYALAYQSETDSNEPFPAVVLYPQMGPPCADVVYELKHGLHGAKTHIIVRAIDWGEASRMMRDPTQKAELPLIAEQWTRPHIRPKPQRALQHRP